MKFAADTIFKFHKKDLIFHVSRLLQAENSNEMASLIFSKILKKKKLLCVSFLNDISIVYLFLCYKTFVVC